MAKGMNLAKREDPVDYWATRVVAAMNTTVESIFATGHELLAAKAALAHGQWEQLFPERVPMSVSTAQKLIAVAKAQERLCEKQNNVLLLPPSWGTLYELTTLPLDTLDDAFAAGKITPELTRAQVKALKAAPTDEAEDTPNAYPDWSGCDENQRAMRDLRASGQTHDLVRRARFLWPESESARFLVVVKSALLGFGLRLEE